MDHGCNANVCISWTTSILQSGIPDVWGARKYVDSSKGQFYIRCACGVRTTVLDSTTKLECVVDIPDGFASPEPYAVDSAE